MKDLAPSSTIAKLVLTENGLMLATPAVGQPYLELIMLDLGVDDHIVFGVDKHERLLAMQIDHAGSVTQIGIGMLDPNADASTVVFAKASTADEGGRLSVDKVPSGGVLLYGTGLLALDPRQLTFVMRHTSISRQCDLMLKLTNDNTFVIGSTLRVGVGKHVHLTRLSIDGSIYGIAQTDVGTFGVKLVPEDGHWLIEELFIDNDGQIQELPGSMLEELKQAPLLVARTDTAAAKRVA